MESESTTSMNSVLNNMQRRDLERKLVIENKKAKQDKSEVEGVDYFDSVFNKKVSEIQDRLNLLKSGDELVKIQEEFVIVARDLKELQSYFTGSTLFLNDRKIQNCQDLINQLVAKSDEVKTKLVPKKKFGFKNKSTAANPPVKMELKVDEAKEPVKEFEWTDAQKRNQFIELTPEKTNSNDLTFKDIENCVIIIKGHAGSVQLSKMKNCLILCGPIARSLFADNCENCIFAITCQQLRLHTSKLCKIYIKVTSRAIIEDCKEISFAPLTYTYEGYDEDLDKAGLDNNTNNWENIGDFNWLSTDKQSPNWNRIQEDEKIENWPEFIEKFKIQHEILQ